ncbi:GNAT family N-acetyltransferase [Microbacterium kribbense]|uniref:GNAT family N-acetyltransferase n=1 Tax=Microbacterium kribbense TaxID=433645 RepID=A0ABP7GQL3_9MICO
MTATLAAPHVRPLIMPESADAADAADFVQMVRVRNEVYRELNGYDDESRTPAEMLPLLQSGPYELTLPWIALLEEQIVGRGILNLPLEDGSRVADVTIELLPRVWGHGVGSALYAVLERAAREHGRTVLQTWAYHPTRAPIAPGDAAPWLDSPTGFGRVPQDHSARFAHAHGFALEQVERTSALELTADADARIQALLMPAQRAAAGYRIVRWMPPTPPELIDGYAWLKSRMVTDAPAAGLELDEQVWDAARVADHERPVLAAGRTMLITAAEHIESGELVAFNELVIGRDLTAATFQEDTLVRADHRGHRLGMLLKCAGLLAWRRLAPDSPRVITYNAEENRPMLQINEAIGFAPIAYLGAWKKTLIR